MRCQACRRAVSMLGANTFRRAGPSENRVGAAGSTHATSWHSSSGTFRPKAGSDCVAPASGFAAERGAQGQLRLPRPDPEDLPVRRVTLRFLTQLRRQRGGSVCAKSCRTQTGPALLFRTRHRRPQLPEPAPGPISRLLIDRGCAVKAPHLHVFSWDHEVNHALYGLVLVRVGQLQLHQKQPIRHGRQEWRNCLACRPPHGYVRNTRGLSGGIDRRFILNSVWTIPTCDALADCLSRTKRGFFASRGPGTARHRAAHAAPHPG